MQGWLKTGLVSYQAGKYTPGPKLTGLPLLGNIGAGFPSPAEEELSDAITLDDYLIHNRTATFIVKVTGDSMIDAGIQPDDLVIVERSRQPKSGDIVIANIDNAWTLKYYRQRGQTIWLEAANKKYPSLHPTAELSIDGVVTGVVRKYH